MVSKFLLIFYLVSVLKCLDQMAHATPLPEDVLVTIDQGTLKGYVANDYFGHPYYGFQSIPYAEPPLGPLRFHNPVPAKSWSPKILDATVPSNICVQFMDGIHFDGSEDCLYLQVYTKNLPKNGSENLKPVMVYIHGGAFLAGSVFENFGPGFLMTEDVVLVLVEYRLGLLGFLSVDDPKENIPGNFGLKDQVLALKWVQNNIRKFGGDPNCVTIFGVSAGGTSVHLHLLSSASKGLFHRAIMQSGVPDFEKITNSQYEKFAELLNCSTNNESEKLIECLQKRSTKQIMLAQNQIVTFQELGNGTVGYVIEPKSTEAFLTEPIDQIIAKGTFNHVPFISGYVTHDGIFAMFTDTHIFPNFTDPELLIPTNVQIPKGSPKSIMWGNNIKEFYYGSSVPSYQNLDPYIQYFTDVLILYPTFKYTEQIAKISRANTYFYHFNYHTKLDRVQIVNFPKPLVQHGDENHYLFVNANTPKSMDPKSEEFIGMHRMIKLWTTFAKTGNPNPVEVDPLINVRWEPIRDVFNYLEISPDMAAKIDPANERIQFWRNFYQNCCNN